MSVESNLDHFNNIMLAYRELLVYTQSPAFDLLSANHLALMKKSDKACMDALLSLPDSYVWENAA